MGNRLISFGMGSFLLGWAGNVFVEVFPMTGWVIPQEVARIIVFVCLGFMLIGVILLLLSFRKSKNVYREQIAITSERLRVSEERLAELDRAKTIELRQEYAIKRQILDKLLEIDNYLASVIGSQDITAENLTSMAGKLFKWYHWFTLIFMTLTYSKKLLRRIFKNTHINYVIRFATRFNLVLREYELGTLPTIEKDKEYLQMYQEVIQLESGLPIHITTKIHRNILLSVTLNSIRIFRSDNAFWDEVKAKPTVEKPLILLRNSLSILMMQIDNSLTALRSEVSSDIERYFRGK